MMIPDSSNTKDSDPSSSQTQGVQTCFFCQKSWAWANVTQVKGFTGGEFYVCDSCNPLHIECLGDCKRVVALEVNQTRQFLQGAVQVSVAHEIMVDALCPSCASEKLCWVCNSFLLVNGKPISGRNPKVSMIESSYVCGTCQDYVDYCSHCDDEVVWVRGKAQPGAVESQVGGESIWACKDCGKSGGTILCVCGKQKFVDNGKKLAEPAKILNGHIYCCNECKGYKLIMCDECENMVAAVRESPEMKPLSIDRGNIYTDPDGQLALCRSCLTGTIRCGICITPTYNANQKPLRFKGGFRYRTTEDGIYDYRCIFCKDTITSSIIVNQLLEGIYKWLLETFQIQPFTCPTIDLRDSQWMRQSVKKAHEPGITRGYYDSDLGRIFIEFALPETLFMAVAAHELAHAWQSSAGVLARNDLNNKKMIIEGFAEWVSYTYLSTSKEVATAKAQALQESMKRDPTAYGDGLNYFLQIAAASGVNEVLNQAGMIKK